MKVTAVVNASHVERESITHQCDNGKWEDPTESFRFVREFESWGDYNRNRSRLIVDAARALRNYANSMDHCRCRRLLKPGAKWAKSVSLSVTLHPEVEEAIKGEARLIEVAP